MRLFSKHLVFLRIRNVYYVCGIVSTLIIGSKEQGVLSYSSFQESVFAALLGDTSWLRVAGNQCCFRKGNSNLNAL